MQCNLMFTYILSDFGNKHMSDIATKLGPEWRRLAVRLGVDFKKIDEIEAKYSSDQEYAAYVMLLQWRDDPDTSMEQKRQDLLRALQKMNRPDIQDLV